MRRELLVAGMLIAGCVGLAAEEQASSPRTLLEAGKYQEAVDAVAARGGEADPGEIYVAGQSLMRLDRNDDARETFRRLDTGDEDSVWTLVGRSAVSALDGNLDAAMELATRATSMAPDHLYAHHQLGLIRLRAEDFGGAAEAFARATEIDGTDAYSHYYAGIAFNKVRRMDKMTEHFRAFVALAPEAPERHQVESILRTLRR